MNTLAEARHSNMNNALRWGSMVVIVGVAVTRCVILFAPQVLFDIDPAFNPNRLAGLSPAGSLALDALLIAACGLAMLGESLSGRGVHWLYFVLALLPAPVMLWHGVSELGDLWKGSTWLSAVLACITIAHLARENQMRLVIIALLLGIAAPLLVRGAGQVTYEHAETLTDFQDQKDNFYKMRGWEPDSPSARIYERRLRQNNPQGWFVTTNVYASFMAMLLCAYLGLAIASFRARLTSGWWATMSLVLVGLGIGLWMCDSTGALAATAGGLVVLLAPLTSPLVSRLFSRFGGMFLVLSLIATLAGVWVRGGLLPEGFAGEKSLLFRWHYTIASVRVLAEEPITGVGADGFQNAYVRHRVPRNPEEVNSAHNMFMDWLTSFGIVGGTWIALVILLIWRAAAAGDEDSEGDEVKPVVRRALLMGIGIAVIGLGGAMAVEVSVTKDPMTVLMRTLGAIGFAVLAALIASIQTHASRRWIGWSLVAGTMALLIHGQIEMTFAQPGAVVWALAMLGVCAPLPAGSPRRGAGVLFALILIALAVWVAAGGAAPSFLQQTKLREAASVFADFPRETSLRVQRRHEASELLVEAHDILPSNPHPIERAAQQLVFGAMRLEGAERIGILKEALALTVRTNHPERGFIFGLRASIFAELARTSGDPNWWDHAIEERRRITRLDPQGNVAWKRLGSTLWEAGHYEDAREAYQRALEADDAFELDPLKQLPAADRAAIEQRVRSAP